MRVRVATFKLHLLLSSNSPKRLGPILKDIIGIWLLAQYDFCSEVRDSALKSFESAFPNKLSNVLNFAEKEIVEYISNNLLVQTSQSISDSRFTSAGEAMDKYNMTVSGSFDVLSLLLGLYYISYFQKKSQKLS
jgi:hypothetical protein